MIWNLINLIFRWLSIKRWNNYPRIQDFTESEHISLKLNIAYIVSSILREKWKKVNLLYIYKHIFWSSFFTFIYSDINYDIKKSLKKTNPEIYNKLWSKLWDFFTSSEIDIRIKNDFKYIVDLNIEEDDKYKLEDNIINLVKSIERKLEIYDNTKFYSLSYWNILDLIEDDIKKYSDLTWFTNLELIDIYLSHLIKLKFSYRWNRNKRINQVSVLSHLFFVFSFSYFLWILKNFSEDDMEEILNISLLHDFPETITWDVITPTKNAVPEFRSILEEIEREVVNEQFLSYFSNFSFVKNLERYTLRPFEWDIWKIAKYSDSLSALFEAKIENDIVHNVVYKDIRNLLWLKNDKELDYILKYWVDYFEEDVELKWKKFRKL